MGKKKRFLGHDANNFLATRRSWKIFDGDFIEEKYSIRPNICSRVDITFFSLKKLIHNHSSSTINGTTIETKIPTTILVN